MIGVIYAPKSPDQAPSTATASQPAEKEVDVDRAPATPSGERKMNVVRGGQSMFARKETAKPAASMTTAGDVGWGTWAWHQIVGSDAQDKKPGTGTLAVVSSGGVVAGGGGQSNVVVKALKGLSETIFGF